MRWWLETMGFGLSEMRWLEGTTTGRERRLGLCHFQTKRLPARAGHLELARLHIFTRNNIHALLNTDCVSGDHGRMGFGKDPEATSDFDRGRGISAG